MINLFHSLQPVAKRFVGGLRTTFDRIGVMVASEGKTFEQMNEAEKVLDLLTATYPGHPWAVRVDSGIIFIRHLAFGANWGMNLKTKEVDHDAAVLKKQIVMLAGEWLERAGLSRSGFFDPDTPDYRVDGVPERFQPPNLQKKDDVKLVDDMPERIEARAQVARMAGA